MSVQLVPALAGVSSSCAGHLTEKVLQRERIIPASTSLCQRGGIRGAFPKLYSWLDADSLRTGEGRAQRVQGSRADP